MSEAGTAFNLVLLLLFVKTTEKEIETLHECETKLKCHIEVGSPKQTLI